MLLIFERQSLGCHKYSLFIRKKQLLLVINKSIVCSDTHNVFFLHAFINTPELFSCNVLLPNLPPFSWIGITINLPSYSLIDAYLVTNSNQLRYREAASRSGIVLFIPCLDIQNLYCISVYSSKHVRSNVHLD